MAKKLGFIVMLSMCLLILKFSRAQEESPSPSLSPEHEPLADSPLTPSSSPEADSPMPPASSPQPQSLADSPSPPEADSPMPSASSSQPESLADSPSPPPPSPQPESPSAPSPSPGPAPVPAPSDDDSDDDSDPETEYFLIPAPSPAPEFGEPDDIKASEDGGNEFEEGKGEDSRMSGLKKAGIAIGAILGVGAIVIGALVYKKRRDNMTRARYTYFNQEDFL